MVFFAVPVKATIFEDTGCTRVGDKDRFASAHMIFVDDSEPASGGSVQMVCQFAGRLICRPAGRFRHDDHEAGIAVFKQDETVFLPDDPMVDHSRQSGKLGGGTAHAGNEEK